MQVLVRGFVVLAACVAFVLPARADGDAIDDLWSGGFVYAGDDRERAEIRASIDRATSSMGPIARLVARSKLTNRMRPEARLRIEVGDESVMIATGKLWKTPSDGSARVLADSEGALFRVRHRLDGLRIFQEIRDDDFVVRNVFALTPDGSRVVVKVSFAHRRIPEAIAYDLTYARER